MLTKDLKRQIDRTGTARLTLVNSYHEIITFGNLTDSLILKDTWKLRWKLPSAQDHWHPFTYAVLHTERRIMAAYEIIPVWLKDSKNSRNGV